MKDRKMALFRFLIITAIIGLTATIFAANPIITNIFTADPAPMVYNDRFYIYCGRDEAAVGQNQFVIREWRVLSTTDMVNWTDHGAPLRYNTFSWGTGDAWASQCVRGLDGRFYWYVSVNDNAPNGWMSIGVAVSDSPTGPFWDAKGTWLVNDQTPNSSPLNIDPTVFVDDDGQVYMYWGSYWGLRAVRLKSNMIELDGPVITPQGVQGFWEAPFLWKRNGLYYLAYAAGANPAVIDYCTSNNPMGPWTYRGRLCDTVSSPTNHPGVAEYKGNWYYVYHNANAPGGGEYRRSVCAELMYYNADGTIRKIVQTTSGPPPVGGFPTPTPIIVENLALTTTATTSYCSSWETITALNDGFDPIHSNDRRYVVYGNWPQTGTQWVQYDWSSPVTINKADVYWFDDNQGIDLPSSCRLKYWNGSSYVNVANPVGLGVAGDQYNTTTFNPVTTTSLRLEMTGNGTYSTGILEWKVYGVGGIPTPTPTPTGVQNKTVRVFWLKPSDVAYDQRIVDGIANVMLEAQRYYRQELGKTFKLNNPIVEVVYGDHPQIWYETNNPGGDPYWYTTTNLRDELMSKYGVRMWDARWKVVGYISAEGNGCGPHGWVLLPKHDTDGAAGYRFEPMSRWYGGMIHELGHAFNLPDASYTDGTPMSASFYNYPNCHFTEAQKNQLLTDSRNSGFWY